MKSTSPTVLFQKFISSQYIFKKFVFLDTLVGSEELEVLEEHIRELSIEKKQRLKQIKKINKDVETLFEENRIKLNEKSSLNQLKSDKNAKIDKGSINRYRKSLEKVNLAC